MAGRVSSRLLGLLFAVSVLLMVAASVVPAHAVEYGNIGGIPAYPDPKNARTQSIFIHTINPGGSAKDGVQVVNYTNEKKTLLVYATDSIVSSGGAFGCSQLADEQKAVGTWIKLKKSEVTLEPQSKETIDFTVSPPASADVGENDGCIIIQDKNGKPKETTEEGSKISINFRTAIRLAVMIPGDIKKSLKIVGYAATPGKDKDFVLKPRVKNDGNVSLDTTLKITTGPMLGGKKEQYSQQFPVLRGVTSDWNVVYKRPFWGGFIRSQFSVTYDTNTTNGLGESSNQNFATVTSKSITFFSMPKLLALLLYLFVLAAVAVCNYLLARKRKEKRKVVTSWHKITITNMIDIETLAKNYGVSWKVLAKANRLKPPYILKSGDIVRVPSKDTRAASSNEPFIQQLLRKIGREKPTGVWVPITIRQPIDIESLGRGYNTSWKLLARVNNLKPPYILKPGDVIHVPEKSGTASVGAPNSWPGTGMLSAPARRKLTKDWEYITLRPSADGFLSSQTDIEAVAKTYGVPWKLLAKINNLQPPYTLKPGDRLKVPPKQRHPKI